MAALARIPAWFWLVLFLLVSGGVVAGNYISTRVLKI